MGADASNIHWHASDLSREARWGALGGSGGTVWLTGLSGSGKSTVAAALEHSLVKQGRYAYRLDGDNIRHGINGDLSFSAEDRAENIRRIGEVARLFADSGCITVASFISPYRRDRLLVRQLHERDGLAFVEVFVDTPLAVCEARDPKGLYKKARAGTLTGFTGIDDPYEGPEAPELVLNTEQQDLAACVAACHDVLRAHKLI